tara:strand:- start:6422 stop:6595 length:174 start_codon:yes stop_codon:yes gene_type:complete
MSQKGSERSRGSAAAKGSTLAEVSATAGPHLPFGLWPMLRRSFTRPAIRHSRTIFGG